MGLVALVVATVSILSSVPAAADAAVLPDTRQWEMVSPPAKNGADIMVDASEVRAARHGGAVAFASLGSFGDVGGNLIVADYAAVRGDSAWATHGLSPAQQSLTFYDVLFLGHPGFQLFSEDVSRAVYLAKSPLTDVPNVALARNLYLREDVRTAGPGSYRLVTDATTPQAGFTGIAGIGRTMPATVGASQDFRHVVFESRRDLTDDAIAASLDPSAPKLYQWVDGAVRLVGIRPDGTVAPASQAGRGALNRYRTDRTVSEDGSRITFTVPDITGALCDPACGEIYLRDDHGTDAVADDTTVAVNASERTDCADDPNNCTGSPSPDPGGPQPAEFWSASSDGRQIFFTTGEQLTDDDNSGTDVYRYDADAAPGEHLTRLSVDQEPLDGVGGDVGGVIGASEDGGYVYFTVTGDSQFASGGHIGPTGGPVGGARIFVWHEGDINEVAGINVGLEQDEIQGAVSWSVANSIGRMTPDGTHLAFTSQGTDELTGYNHDGNPNCIGIGAGPPCAEVYVYDATANAGAGSLRCASCNPTGQSAKADATMVARFAFGASALTPYRNRSITDDGRLVFFTSADRLVPDDTNGVEDAYEYNTETGQIHLLSSGQGSAPSFFLDASGDGKDVFIITRNRLVSRDTDDTADLYDVRINGFVDNPAPPKLPCEGDACRPDLVDPSSFERPHSSTFTGPRDTLERSGTPPLFAVHPLRVAERRAWARRGTVTLIVNASEEGRIEALAKARIGKRSRVVARAARSFQGSARVRLPLKLSNLAQRQLNRKGKLRVAIVVDYSRVAAPQRLAVTLHAR